MREEMGRACQLVGLLYVAFGVMDALLIRDMLPYLIPTLAELLIE
jgi:hypothetical protein